MRGKKNSWGEKPVLQGLSATILPGILSFKGMGSNEMRKCFTKMKLTSISGDTLQRKGKVGTNFPSTRKGTNQAGTNSVKMEILFNRFQLVYSPSAAAHQPLIFRTASSLGRLISGSTVLGVCCCLSQISIPCLIFWRDALIWDISEKPRIYLWVCKYSVPCKKVFEMC